MEPSSYSAPASFPLDRLLSELDLMQTYLASVLEMKPPRIELLAQLLDRFKKLIIQIPGNKPDWTNRWNETFLKLSQKCSNSCSDKWASFKSASFRQIESPNVDDHSQLNIKSNEAHTGNLQESITRIKDKYDAIVDFIKRQNFSGSYQTVNTSYATVNMDDLLEYIAVANSVFQSIGKMSSHESRNVCSSIEQYIGTDIASSFIGSLEAVEVRPQVTHCPTQHIHRAGKIIHKPNKPANMFAAEMDPSVGKARFRAMMVNEFRQIAAVHSDTDLPRLNKLTMKLAKSIKLGRPFCFDMSLREQLLGLALNKLPEELQCKYRELCLRNESLGELRRFVARQAKTALQLDEQVKHFMENSAAEEQLRYGPWKCEICRCDEHATIKCAIRKKLLCLNCYQLGHLKAKCRNKPYL